MSFNNVRFTVPLGEGKNYHHFPKHLCGKYQTSFGWTLFLAENELVFMNAQNRLEIHEALSPNFKLKKFQGFYLMERSIGDASNIVLMRANKSCLIFHMPRLEGWDQIPNKSSFSLGSKDGVTTYRTNTTALNALLLNGFFSYRLQLEKMKPN